MCNHCKLVRPFRTNNQFSGGKCVCWRETGTDILCDTPLKLITFQHSCSFVWSLCFDDTHWWVCLTSEKSVFLFFFSPYHKFITRICSCGLHSRQLTQQRVDTDTPTNESHCSSASNTSAMSLGLIAAVYCGWLWLNLSWSTLSSSRERLSFTPQQKSLCLR